MENPVKSGFPIDGGHETKKKIMTLGLWKEALSVGIFAYFGVAIRYAIVSSMRRYESGSVSCTEPIDSYISIFQTHSYILPNIFGSLLMGVLVSRSSDIVKLDEALYKGLTTGLCGCITTFSTWMVSSVYKPFQAYSFVIIYVQLCLYWCSFMVGISLLDGMVQLWTEFSLVISKQRQNHSSSHPQLDHEENISHGGHVTKNISEDDSATLGGKVACDPDTNAQASVRDNRLLFLYILVFIVLSLFVAISLIVCEISYHSSDSVEIVQFHDLVRNLLFGPLGAWLRWGLSKFERLKNFKPFLNLHTMSANLIAVVASTLLQKYLANIIWTSAVVGGAITSFSEYISHTIMIYET